MPAATVYPQSTMYLVDGNNVMGQRVGWHRDKSGARQRLIGELAQLAERWKTTLAVVFDAPRGTRPQRAGRVHVFYARSGGNADDCIIEIAQRWRRRHRFVVVTSDRGLAARVAELGIEVVRAGEFRRLLSE